MSEDPVISDYHAISTGKLRREFSFKNISDFFSFIKGIFQARKLLKDIEPEFLLTTGGYVCLPAAVAAWNLNIPVIAHEQTSVPGLANRIVFRIASEILTTFDILPSDKTSRVGNPPRKEARLRIADKSRVPGTDPVLLITGGANGSRILNEFVFNNLDWLTDNFTVFHQFGMHEDNYGTSVEKVEHINNSKYEAAPFFPLEKLLNIYDRQPVVLARSGAGTVNDIACFSLSSVLIPLASSAGGEQKSNANYLLKNGAALVIEEKDADVKKIKQALLNAYVAREKTGSNISRLLTYDMESINKILDLYM
jgi:UDP-N-acetylglucosamine--N-acetylmuramyl-(pentapeptide) pyrophosphoryl-undecaprenol N-acetylglucosamine transferase